MDYCRMAVLYLQTMMIGNQAQGLALLLAMLTAYASSAKEYASVAVMGELSSGKTMLVKIILGVRRNRQTKSTDPSGLIPQPHIFHFTSSSPMAMIYNSDLRDFDSPIRIIEASEYQKLGNPVIEYLKAQSGDDGIFVYSYTDITKKDTEEIEQKKRVFVFTYAQNALDGELASRIIRFAVEENDEINKCVTNLRHEYPSVTYKGLVYDLKPNLEIEQRIKDQIGFIASSKPIEVTNPFYEALRDLEDCSRPSSKRTAQLIEDLFKSSARFNFTEREFVGRNDDCTTIRMSAQDIVNVLCLTDIIQAIVLEIDTVDMGILRYLGMRGKHADSTMIINFLASTGLPELKQVEFDRRIDELINSNYINFFDDRETKKKRWYGLNPDKYIHALKVHWQDALKIDDSEVMNPITGQRYANIAEFGEEFDEIIRKGIEVNTRVDPKATLTFEERLERTVKRLITTGSKYSEGEESKLMKDCMVEFGETNNLIAFEKFQKAVSDLMRKGIFKLDPVTRYYRIPDPSLEVNRKSEYNGRSRLTYIPEVDVGEDQ